MDQEKEELAPREWTYMGRYETTKGGLGSRWLDHRGEEVAYSKGPKDAVVGGVFEVRCVADASRAEVRSPRWLRASDHPNTDQWRLDDRQAYLADAARKAQARAAKENGSFGSLTLDQLRRQMLQTGGTQRGALIAAVIGYLEGGGR